MPNESVQNENNEQKQSNQQVNRNPTRNNTNVNQGQNDEKNFSGENPARGVEVNPSRQVERKEIDLDRNGISNAGGTGSSHLAGSEKTNQAGQGLQNPRGVNAPGEKTNKNQDEIKKV